MTAALTQRHLAFGARIARRYQLGRKLGEGTTGEVWTATDTVTATDVAVKVIFPSVDAGRVHREVAALRMLRLPGVVRFIADGVADGVSYIVTELLTGQPFPGLSSPVRWEDIEDIAISAFETLYQIHTAGLVHCDLKPENILVVGGKPVILDFGLAGFETTRSDSAGSLVYMAPEQLRGSMVTPATDLYTMGVILYEALSGKWPHPIDDPLDLMRSRLCGECPSLAAIAPHVPRPVANAIDSLLSSSAELRPASALDAIALLTRGRNRPAILPWLGRSDTILRIARIVRGGGSIDVVGASGMGRTRTLADVVRALHDRETIWLCSGESAFSSLAPVIGAVHTEPKARFSDVTASVTKRIEERFARGLVLIADNAERLDSSSKRLLDEARGPIVRALTTAREREHIALEPLDIADVMPLFDGHEELFHLRRDGATHVIRRTGGVPREIAREIDALVAHGNAEWLEGRIVMSRTALDHVEGEHVPIAPIRLARDISTRVDTVLCALQLAPTIEVETLARALGRAEWEVDGELEELHRDGTVRRVGDRWVPLARAPQFDALGPGERQMWHARIAASMPSGSDCRYAHLLASAKHLTDDVVLEVVKEAHALAARWACEGHLRRALSLLSETVGLVRTVATRGATWKADWLDRLFSLWVAVAVDDGSPVALDRVMHEVIHDERYIACAQQLVALVRAARRLHVWTDEALDVATALPPFKDPVLDRKRQAVRVYASRRASLEVERDVVQDARKWAAGDPIREASAEVWLGRALYREGRYADAVAAYLRGIHGISWRTERIAASIHAAAAMLETLEHTAARDLGERALEEAVLCRHATLEVRAHWVKRCAEYRLALDSDANPVLVAASERLGDASLTASLAFEEAAFAFRRGNLQVARDLLALSAEVWSGGGNQNNAVLGEALAVACGLPLSSDDHARIYRDALDLAPRGLGLQAVALLAMGGGPRPNDTQVHALVSAIPVEERDHRMDVLSPNEALAAITGVQPPYVCSPLM